MFKVVKKKRNRSKWKKIKFRDWKDSKTSRWSNYSSMWRDSCFSNSCWCKESKSRYGLFPIISQLPGKILCSW